ncbi:hypothetical protein CU024_0724 [Enterococcus faecium]|nr:hypothetical protein [Enterococcus faecium]MBK4781385.1 hypothetical protein [Enterococcus faecium]MBK4786736.1 hypothetical protein [Enterococcus faecium]MBK4850222.1 hypothetical protein [Enterococcus faecium]MBK4873959.1 hypothetical protein [Enterococcus faecium]
MELNASIPASLSHYWLNTKNVKISECNQLNILEWPRM